MWELGHSVPATEDVDNLADIVVRALPAEEFPYLLEHIQQHLTGFGHGGASEFEYGLDLILDGLQTLKDAPREDAPPVRAGRGRESS